MEYTFPFDTCEQVCENCVAQQPYSTAINAISTLVLTFFLFKAKTFKFKLVIAGLVAFEALHTYSHYIHIPGNTQQNALHIIVYYIIGTSIIALSDNKPLSNLLISAFVTLFLIDLYIYLKVKKVYMIMSGSLLYVIVFILLYNRLELPKKTHALVIKLLALIVVIAGLIVNEAINCRKMMGIYAFPYHILIELLGLVMFSLMASVYCNIEKAIVA